MADEQKPEGPAPPAAGGPTEPAKPAAEAPKAATRKPAAPAAHAPPKPPAPMAVIPWEGELPAQLKERFGGDIAECASYLGQNFAVVKADALIPVIEYLKLEADFEYLVDITAVDYPKRAERFDLVYVLYSFSRNERMRVKANIADGAQPQTAVNVHTGANWLEREVFDMFGIQFAGHPDMRRILLPEEYEGFPLRKEKAIIQQDHRLVDDNLCIRR